VEEDTFTKQWRVVVLDEGSGVSSDELEAIFEPFFRSGKGNNHKGYGLGLAITRRVVEAHGGTVMAKNQPGSGLAVTILLPIYLV
jgi:signal transduction histidine kinase